MRQPRSPRLIVAAAAIAAVPASAGAQWSTDPAANTPIATGPAGQVLPRIAATSDGGCWISWFVSVPGPVFYHVRVQRLDAQGNKLLGPDGLLVSDRPQLSFLVDYDLGVDSGNNALVAFTDVRDGGTDREVSVYRVSSSGQFLWGADGVMLSSDGSDDVDPRIVQTSDGNYTVVWPRVSLPAGGPPRGLIMQRLDAAGNTLLPAGGVLIAGGGIGGSGATDGPAFAQMVAADNDSVIVLFAKDTRTFSSPRNPTIQKYNSSGAGLWNGGNAITLNASAIPLGARFNLVSDGASGAIAAWYDNRGGGTSFDSWVQRLDAVGNQLFPAGGSAVSTFNTDRLHLNPSDPVLGPIGETYVFWREENASQSQWGVFGQRFDTAGVRQWTSAGRELIPVNTTNKFFIRSARLPGAQAGAVMYCLDEPNGPNQGSRVLGVRVDGAGNPVWATSPLAVSSIVSVKGRLPVTTSSDGAALLAWEDQRSDPGNDAYAQRVNADGTLGNPACEADFNSDGSVNSQDFFDFLAAFFGSDPAADFNHDGVVNSQDFFDFLAAFFAGC